MTYVTMYPAPQKAWDPKRMANAYVLDGVCVVDPLPDMKLADTVTCVTVTHAHNDHTVGLDALIAKGLRYVTRPDGWEAVSTPGHADPHIAFLRDGILIAGDTIEGPGGAAPLVTRVTGGDMAAHIDTTVRLAEMKLKTVYPGHGGVILNPRIAYRTLLEYRLEQEDKVRSMLSRTDGQIAAKLYPDHRLGAAIVAAYREKLLRGDVTA